MITVIPHVQNPSGKRSGPAGGRIRSSCGYHHQRHQACPDTCEGRKVHPPTSHSPVRDKFSVGCTQCQTFFADQHNPTHELVSTPTSSSHKPRNIHLQYPPSVSPSSPSSHHQQQHDQRLSPLQHFISKLEDSTSSLSSSLSSPPRSPTSHTAMIARSSPPLQQQQKLASLANEVEFELMQQHQHEISLKRRQLEHEEQLVLQYRAQLERLRAQQDSEHQRIQQQQHVLEYQKQQQALELQRIQQHQQEIEDAQRDQDALRLKLKQDQVELELLRANCDQERARLSPVPALAPASSVSSSPSPTPVSTGASSVLPTPPPTPFKEIPTSFAPPTTSKDSETQDALSEASTSSPRAQGKRSYADMSDTASEEEIASKRRQSAC